MLRVDVVDALQVGRMRTVGHHAQGTTGQPRPAHQPCCMTAPASSHARTVWAGSRAQRIHGAPWSQRSHLQALDKISRFQQDVAATVQVTRAPDVASVAVCMVKWVCMLLLSSIADGECSHASAC